MRNLYHGKIRHLLFIKEHTYSIQRVIPDKTNREDRKHSKTTALESPFLLEEKHESNIRREDFGFKSKSTEYVEAFEKESLDMIPNIKFRSVKDTFQKKLKEDIRKIKQSPNVFVFADQTSNIYEMPEQQYKKLLHDSITKTYKKVPPKLEISINSEAKNIAQLINLGDSIECIARKPVFITFKDHKLHFRQNPSCRLINPSKNKLDKVSKLIIEKINEKLISELHFNQWKNTDSVLKLFIDISNKNDCSFIQLDIKEFYPSINEDILTNAIQFAKLHTTIDDKDLHLIMHCRKSLLFFGNETWKKKSTESCFDVTMGSFDGAEICELVGLYIQSNLENILPKTNFGLYRYDRLIILRNLNGQQMDKKRKTIIKMFKSIGFSLDIRTNLLRK